MSEAEADLTSMCDMCATAHHPDDLVQDQAGQMACGECAITCDNCGNAWMTSRCGVVGNGYVALCENCEDDLVTCAWCSRSAFTDDSVTSSWGEEYCDECWDTRCETCGEVFGCDGPTCDSCYDQTYEMDESYQEKFDYTVETFSVREFAQVRGAMNVSYELEFARDPEGMAEALYAAGLSRGPGIAGYSDRIEGACVKYDGSVDGGGELVGAYFKLPSQPETDRFWRTFEVLRNRVKDGENKLDMRCGLHIHVDAMQLDLRAVMSATVAFNYLEDVMYRLASAGWRSHRALADNDYAKPGPKNIESLERFRHMFGDRYLGLNLSNYLASRYNCTCNVGFDRGDLCTCTNRRKVTLEYRLFNTTANHIKMHAYTAIACALVAFGKDKELIASDLTPMEFNYSSVHDRDVDLYIERLRWMFESLPFSAEERNSLRYTIRTSELGPYLERHASQRPELADVVRGILHEDEPLRIPIFIPIRVAEAPTTHNPAVIPPLDLTTSRINPYGDYVYPTPSIPAGEACSDLSCRTCWVSYSYEDVEAAMDVALVLDRNTPLAWLHEVLTDRPLGELDEDRISRMARDVRTTDPLRRMRLQSLADRVYTWEAGGRPSLTIPADSIPAFNPPVPASAWMSDVAPPVSYPAAPADNAVWDALLVQGDMGCGCIYCAALAANVTAPTTMDPERHDGPVWDLNTGRYLDPNGRWRDLRTRQYAANPFAMSFATLADRANDELFAF